MLLDAHCKLTRLSPKDHTRILAIEFAHLDVDAGRAIACNGTALAVVPARCGPDDVSGPLSTDALKAAKGAHIACNGSQKVAGGADYPRPDIGDATYPDWKGMIADRGGETRKIRLNAKLLWELANAMETVAVELEIEGPVHRVVVRPSGTGGRNPKDPAEPDAVGVIMPIYS